jgi:tRNA dimethylallyltransferase
VGKTEVSIELARRLDGEIVSADSRLFYRGMDIGTAKPTPAELKEVRHHLVNVADPDEVWSLAIFKDAAFQAIEDIYNSGRLPFLVGGTGQYIRAVVDGWQIPRTKPDPRLRAELSRWAKVVGPYELHERLAQLDPVAADRIDPRNLRRTVRALEVILSSGRRFSDQRRRGEPPFNHLVLGIFRPRAELYARIDERIQSMLEQGLIEETRALLEKGYPPGLSTLSAIGYKQIIQYLQGQISLEEAVRRIKRKTRIFVRRQANWFKPDDPDIYWFEAGSHTVDEMEAAIRAWLPGEHQNDG